ncbi:MAG: hypothetical protein HYZ21_01060, partial [Chloroflexi bacterium]|nr:hypothetical protein [Chloroflexota bacterium]
KIGAEGDGQQEGGEGKAKDIGHVKAPGIVMLSDSEASLMMGVETLRSG